MPSGLARRQPWACRRRSSNWSCRGPSWRSSRWRTAGRRSWFASRASIRTARRFATTWSITASSPASYDLKNFLRRKDGAPLRRPARDPGQGRSRATPRPDRAQCAGARRVLRRWAAIDCSWPLAGSLWCAGLAAILLLGRRKKSQAEAEASRPVTLADRLRPLVDAALAGTLSEGQHAELERLLIGYWRKRLKLEHVGPAEAIRLMREHEEAGALLRKLEEWLHKPGARAEAAEIAALLRPYQELKSENPGR